LSSIKLRANGHNGPTGTTFFNLQENIPFQGQTKAWSSGPGFFNKE